MQRYDQRTYQRQTFDSPESQRPCEARNCCAIGFCFFRAQNIREDLYFAYATPGEGTQITHPALVVWSASQQGDVCVFNKRISVIFQEFFCGIPMVLPLNK